MNGPRGVCVYGEGEERRGIPKWGDNVQPGVRLGRDGAQT